MRGELGEEGVEPVDEFVDEFVDVDVEEEVDVVLVAEVAEVLRESLISGREDILE